MVPSRDGLETSIIIFAIAFTRFAVMGVAHFTYGAHFGLPSPTLLPKFVDQSDVSESELESLRVATSVLSLSCVFVRVCVRAHLFRARDPMLLSGPPLPSAIDQSLHPPRNSISMGFD